MDESDPLYHVCKHINENDSLYHVSTPMNATRYHVSTSPRGIYPCRVPAVFQGLWQNHSEISFLNYFLWVFILIHILNQDSWWIMNQDSWWIITRAIACFTVPNVGVKFYLCCSFECSPWLCLNMNTEEFSGTFLNRRSNVSFPLSKRW